MNYSDETADEMTRLPDEIEAKGLWDLDAKVDQAMEALRCAPDDADVAALSGGERRPNVSGDGSMPLLRDEGAGQGRPCDIVSSCPVQRLRASARCPASCSCAAGREACTVPQLH
jgi:hypothetical protein